MHTTRHGRRARRSALAAFLTIGAIGAAAGPAAAAPADLDPGFGSGGRTLFGFPNVNDNAYAVAVQPDGKIVVAGATSSGYDGLVARFNADGSPDRSFDGDGITTIDSGGIEILSDVALQPDGKIVVAGGTTTNFDALVARLTPQGQPDTTFDQDGKRTIDSGGVEHVSKVELQPDGKIVVAGETSVNSDGAVYRLTTTGEPDNTFDQDGAVGIDSGGQEFLGGLALQGDGGIVVSGHTSVGDDATVYRLTSAGKPDTTFDQDGARGIDFAGDNEVGWDVAIQPDGRIVIGGTTGTDGNAAFARLSAAGQPDTSFGTGGKTLVDAGGEDVVRDLILQNDGRMLASGGSSGTPGAGILLRLGTDGKPDGSFAPGGLAKIGVDGLGEIFSIALQGDGRLVGAGASGGPQNEAMVLRVQGLRPDPQTGGAGNQNGQGGQGGGPSVTGGDGGTPATAAKCAGRKATIVGTNGRDVIRGTARRDVIAAFGGNDIVRALGGDDIVCAGAGNDTVLGGAGRDVLRGNAGRDRLFGGAGIDRLLGGAGRDVQKQ